MEFRAAVGVAAARSFGLGIMNQYVNAPYRKKGAAILVRRMDFVKGSKEVFERPTQPREGD